MNRYWVTQTLGFNFATQYGVTSQKSSGLIAYNQLNVSERNVYPCYTGFESRCKSSSAVSTNIKSRVSSFTLCEIFVLAAPNIKITVVECNVIWYGK